jgi:hypothetical protein
VVPGELIAILYMVPVCMQNVADADERAYRTSQQLIHLTVWGIFLFNFASDRRGDATACGRSSNERSEMSLS